MKSRLITIRYSESPEEAYLWKAKLESESIKAVIVHDNPRAMPSAFIELQVNKHNKSKALKIIGNTSSIYSKPVKKAIIVNLIIGFLCLASGILMIAFRFNIGGLIFGGLGLFLMTVSLLSLKAK